MKKYILIALSVFIAFALKSQTTVADSILHNGIMRYYSYYVPASYDGVKAFPLVLNLHGYGSAGWQQSIYGEFKPIADTADFIVVHPDGSFQPGSTTTQFWNVGFFPSPVDDVDFLEQVIDSISSRYYINHTRVYTTGMSNGGFMSHELACSSSRFAAIASVTGSMTTQTYNNCNPSKATPVMQIHGTADPTVPYTGNSGFVHVDTVMNFWVNFNNCPQPPSFDSIPNTVITDNARAEHYVWAPGDSSASVELYKVIDGAHSWPGASFIIAVTCQDFSASKEIWRFFSQYGQELPLNIRQEAAFENTFRIWPNPTASMLNFRFDHENGGQVNVYSVDGKLQLNEQFSGSDLQLNVEQLPAGMYILEFVNEKGKLTSKFVRS